MIDLNKLEEMLDNALERETEQSLNDWLAKEREDIEVNL